MLRRFQSAAGISAEPTICAPRACGKSCNSLRDPGLQQVQLRGFGPVNLPYAAPAILIASSGEKQRSASRPAALSPPPSRCRHRNDPVRHHMRRLTAPMWHHHLQVLFRGHNINTFAFHTDLLRSTILSTKAMTASTAYRSAIANGIATRAGIRTMELLLLECPVVWG